MEDSAGVIFSSGMFFSQLISIISALVSIIIPIIIFLEVRRSRKKLEAIEERLNNIESILYNIKSNNK
jgi:preprotein translocase subunit YajC